MVSIQPLPFAESLGKLLPLVSSYFCLFKMETIKPSSESQDLNTIMSETHSANIHGQ